MIAIDEVTVSGTVTEVDLTGISSTYDFYMVKIIGATVDADVNISMRVLNSSTPDTTSNYSSGALNIRPENTPAVRNDNAATSISLCGVAPIASAVAGHSYNATIYLRDFVNSSANSTGSFETVYKSNSGTPDYVHGMKGSFTHAVNQSNNGIRFFTSSNNFDGGRFVLYGINK